MIGPLIFALIFGGFGFAACYAAINGLRAARLKLGRAARALGEVIEMRTDSSGSENTFSYPLVRFQTRTGATVTFEASIREEPPAHKVGDRVDVFYEPDHPETADIVGTETKGYVLLLLLSVPFLLIGVGVLWTCVLFGRCAAQ